MTTTSCAPTTNANYLFSHILSIPFTKNINTKKLAAQILADIPVQNFSGYVWDRNILYHVYNKWIVIKPNKISNNLRHSNSNIDKILHQTQMMIFEKSTGLPLVYIPKQIEYLIHPQNKHENKYVSSIIPDFETCELDSSKFCFYTNTIGEYFVLFCDNKEWMFFSAYQNFDGIHKFNKANHTLLYDHLAPNIHELNTEKCYHIILADNRLKHIISYPFQDNHVLFVKTSEPYTLAESFSNNCSFFRTNEQINITDFNNILEYLSESDKTNSSSNKLHKKGLTCRIMLPDNEDLYLDFFTTMYREILSHIPSNMGLHCAHLMLYQQNKLTGILQCVAPNYIDITKRIHAAMTTMSHELLDIYHATRNHSNNNLYSMLSIAYKKFLYELHRDYIQQKNTNDDIFVAITVEDVYKKLKKIKTQMLFALFVDRINLCDQIQQDLSVLNPMKLCINACIQSHLISSEIKA